MRPDVAEDRLGAAVHDCDAVGTSIDCDRRAWLHSQHMSCVPEQEEANLKTDSSFLCAASAWGRCFN